MKNVLVFSFFLLFCGAGLLVIKSFRFWLSVMLYFAFVFDGEHMESVIDTFFFPSSTLYMSFKCLLASVVSVKKWLCLFLHFSLVFTGCRLDWSFSSKGGDIEVFNHSRGLVYFSHQFYQFLPHIFYCPVVKSISIKDCNTVLENWPLYHFIMLFFFPDKFPSLHSALSKMNITAPAFFWFARAWCIFCHLFAFNLRLCI